VNASDPYVPVDGEGRIRRGWRLTAEAWRVIRSDPTALTLAIVLFAVPVLALEGCTATGCVRRSGELLKRRWGEGVTGTVTITAWVGIAMFPVAIVVAIAGAAAGGSYAVTFAIEMGVVVLLAGLAGAARNVFGVALYRYAANGEVQAFPERDLARPFSPKRRRGGR